MRFYSNAGYYIQNSQTNEIYSEAIDTQNNEYIETNQIIPEYKSFDLNIEKDNSDWEAEAQEAYIKGVTEA